MGDTDRIKENIELLRNEISTSYRERWNREIADDLESLTAENERLREVCKSVRLILLAEDGEVPTLDDDWTPLHEAISELDSALAARDRGGEG